MTGAGAGGQTPGQEPEAPSSFQILCGSLAAQVHMALGLIADPVDQKTRIEIGAARQGIDMLGMLEEKTKGNLDDREKRTLSLLLTQLRMIFVERVKELQEGGSGADAGEAGPQAPGGEAAAPSSEDGPTIVTP